MYRTFSSRVALRAMTVGVGPAACVGAFVATRPVIRCDAPTLATGPPRRRRPSLDISPDTVRQLSSGSVAGSLPWVNSSPNGPGCKLTHTVGFGIGVLVGLFSKTLALLTGLVALSIHVSLAIATCSLTQSLTPLDCFPLRTGHYPYLRPRQVLKPKCFVDQEQEEPIVDVVIPCNIHLGCLCTSIVSLGSTPSTSLNLCCLPLQPSKSKVVALKVTLRLIHNLGIVCVEPFLLLACEKLRVDKVPAVRHHGYVLKAQEGLIPKRVLGLDLLDDDDVLDSNTVLSVFVVSGLVGQHVAWSESHLGELDTSANANRTLVDIQE